MRDNQDSSIPDEEQEGQERLSKYKVVFFGLIW